MSTPRPNSISRANERGRKPYPGVSLLRFAQGKIDAAAVSIRTVLLDTRSRADRASVLGAAVEILLAARDLVGARAAAAELAEIAGATDARLLHAMSAHASGAVLLTDDDMPGAAMSLRQAWEEWHALEMPYEEAHTCLLLAVVCERRGDREGRRLELDAALRLFKQLNAVSCLARIAEQSERPARRFVGALSQREVQVLRLLATGKTNHDIAETLFISEKTVARHVSNIFDKIGVSSRAGATAWAYQHSLT